MNAMCTPLLPTYLCFRLVRCCGSQCSSVGAMTELSQCKTTKNLNTQQAGGTKEAYKVGTSGRRHIKWVPSTLRVNVQPKLHSYPTILWFVEYSTCVRALYRFTTLESRKASHSVYGTKVWTSLSFNLSKTSFKAFHREGLAFICLASSRSSLWRFVPKLLIVLINNCTEEEGPQNKSNLIYVHSSLVAILSRNTYHWHRPVRLLNSTIYTACGDSLKSCYKGMPKVSEDLAIPQLAIPSYVPYPLFSPLRWF